MASIKFFFFLLLITIFVVLGSCEYQKDRGILKNHVSVNIKNFQKSTLRNVQENLRKSMLEHLNKLPQELKKTLIAQADDEYKNGNYSQLTAWDFLEYSRTGDSSKYDAKIAQRIKRLSILVIGHLLAEAHALNTSIYIDQIFNGVWMTLEESTWASPSTVHGLPQPNDVTLDPSTAEMAKQISWIYLMMRKQFEGIKSGNLNARIHDELEKRIFSPFLKYDPAWNGLDRLNATVDSWNMRINNDVLKTAAYTLEKEDTFRQIFNKTMYSVDVFLDNFGDDGGCVEGTSYWQQTGGRLIEYIFTLLEVDSGLKTYFAQQSLIESIGNYSWKLRISGHDYVNFGDNIPPNIYPPSMVYRYGELFENAQMKYFSAFLYEENNFRHEIEDLDGFMSFIATRLIISAYQAVSNPPEPTIVSLPDLQIGLIRSRPERKTSKLLLAGKMGTNCKFLDL